MSSINSFCLKAERINMSHIPPKGYEDAAFFGRNCQDCLLPEDGTPYEAALKFAERFDGSYIIEEEDGWTVYAQLPQLPEIPSSLQQWLDTPLEDHIARWKAETQRGLRDGSGRWIGPERKQGGRG